MKNARAKRAKIQFFIVKYANFAVFVAVVVVVAYKLPIYFCCHCYDINFSLSPDKTPAAKNIYLRSFLMLLTVFSLIYKRRMIHSVTLNIFNRMLLPLDELLFLLLFSDETFFHIRVDACQPVNSLLKLKFKLQSIYIFIAKA